MGREVQAKPVEHYSTYFDSLEKLTIIKNHEVQKRQDLSVNHKPEKIDFSPNLKEKNQNLRLRDPKQLDFTSSSGQKTRKKNPKFDVKFEILARKH